MSVATLPVDVAYLRSERIPFQWASTLQDDASDQREIVEDFITTGALSVWFGDSNAGKSTFVADLAFRMPSGLPWMGKRTEKGAVIYVAGEGAASIRAKAYNPAAGGKGGGDININSTLTLNGSVGPAELRQVLDARDAKLKADLARSRAHGTGVFQ